MACPNYQAEIERLKGQYPAEWKNAHTGNAHTEDFVRIVAEYLHELDPNVGLNGKRGNPNDISDDALNILDPLDGPGTTPEGQRCWVVDFIKDAGLPIASVTWQPFSDPVASSGANVVPGPAPTPPPTGQPYPDEQTWWPQVFDVEVAKRYAQAGKVYPDGPKAFRWASRTAYDIADGMTKEDSLAKHLKELEQELGL